MLCPCPCSCLRLCVNQVDAIQRCEAKAVAATFRRAPSVFYQPPCANVHQVPELIPAGVFLGGVRTGTTW